jgi:hypothetical protein
VVALVAVMAASVVLLAACSGGVATSNKGRVLTSSWGGSVVNIESKFDFITEAAYDELLENFFDLSEEEKYSEIQFAPVIMFGSELGSFENAVSRRNLQSNLLNVFGEIEWGLPEDVELKVGMGFFYSQSTGTWTDLDTAKNNLGSFANVANNLGLKFAEGQTTWSSVAEITAQISAKWNSTGNYTPTGTAAQIEAAEEANKAALLKAVTEFLLPAELVEMGYFYNGNPTNLVFTTEDISETATPNVVVMHDQYLDIIRFVKQTITKIEVVFAEANFASPKDVEISIPRQWAADGKTLGGSEVTILKGETGHAMRPIVTETIAERLYDRGGLYDIWYDVTEINGQVYQISFDLGSITFILNKPANH